MSLEDLAPDEVIALRFEDLGVAEELALWCDGGVLGECVTVPSKGGLATASVGDWIVRDPSGDFSVLPHEKFVLRYGPG